MQQDTTIESWANARFPGLGEPDQARFQALCRAMIAWYEPADALEDYFVRSIATDMLLEQRVRAVEQRVLADHQAGLASDRQCRASLADIKSWRASVERGWRWARAELEDCQARRTAAALDGGEQGPVARTRPDDGNSARAGTREPRRMPGLPPAGTPEMPILAADPAGAGEPVHDRERLRLVWNGDL